MLDITDASFGDSFSVIRWASYTNSGDVSSTVLRGSGTRPCQYNNNGP